MLNTYISGLTQVPLPQTGTLSYQVEDQQVSQHAS